MGRISIDITDEEGKAIKSMLPALDKMRAFIPSQLLSVVHKLEQALKFQFLKTLTFFPTLCYDTTLTVGGLVD